MRLKRATAFWILAFVLGALLFASSVPSPLYVVYQSEWDFSAVTLTSVFAVYALALLAALLVVGSISDHIGRRPTLLVALGLEILAMLAFAGADGVGWLFVARTVQGFATGTAMGALSAALLDLQPAEKPWLGALMGAVAPLGGLALGALSAGLLVDYGPDSMRFVFWLLIGVFVLSLMVVRAIPETVESDGRWRDSLKPSVAVPREMRAAFMAAIPSLAATWALGGLILSLGGSLTSGVLGETSHLAAGLPIFVMAGISALASIRWRSAPARATTQRGLVALIAGVAVALAAIAVGSEILFLGGAAIAGVGFGPAFAGVFRMLTALVTVGQRAALVSSVLTVCYLAFSLPAIAAGAAVPDLGLRETAEIYGGLLIALSALALVLSRGLREAPRTA
jgi:MFS family permease